MVSGVLKLELSIKSVANVLLVHLDLAMAA